MTYSVYPITDIADIPPLVKSFAVTLGFVTGGGGTDITVKHPTYVGARVFGVRTEVGGVHPSTSYEDVIVTCDGSDGSYARARSPKLNPSQGNTDAAVIIVKPTKLHLFGSLGGGVSDPGKTFISGVIEYGFNLYRHFHIGYVEKITAFDGGEVISGSLCWWRTTPITTGSSYTRNYDQFDEMMYPFSANNGSGYRNNGGVYINHPNNPNSWREFAIMANFPSSSTLAAFNTMMAANGDKMVLGGFKDAINTGYVAAGKAPYSGVNVLGSVNLYIGKRVGGTQYLQAIGRVYGVRMVHMEDLNPGDQITVGTSVWRVFPVFAKSTARTMGGTGGPSTDRTFPTNNTSHYVGMAYLVSE